MSTQAALSSQTGSDMLVDWMVAHQIPVTRQTYLEQAYPDGLPEPWTAELEAALPKELQEV